MTNIKKILSVAVIAGISACTTLSTEDRKLIDDIKLTSETAKYDSQKALRAAEIAVQNSIDAKEHVTNLLKQVQNK